MRPPLLYMRSECPGRVSPATITIDPEAAEVNVPVQLLMEPPTTASKRCGPEKRSSHSCAGIMRLAGGKAVPARPVAYWKAAFMAAEVNIEEVDGSLWHGGEAVRTVQML